MPRLFCSKPPCLSLTSAACGALILISSSVAGSLSPTLTGYLDGVEGFSGTVLVGRTDGTSERYARGLADDAQARAFAEGDIWRWASVTKQIVAVMVLQEVAAGRLTLETPLSEALPEFATPYASELTVRRLLKHRSGLPNPEDLSPAVFAKKFDPAVFCAGPPAGPPGGEFEYNNCDYYVLGAVIGHTAGAAWAEVLRDRILEPAGMAQTAVAPGEPKENVTGYLTAGKPVPPVNLAAFDAAGAIQGAPADLLRFNRALLDGRLLAPEWLDVLWESEPAEGFAALGAWSFPAQLEGCPEPLRVVERHGYINGIAVRNFLVPDLGGSLVAFSNRADFEFGQVWMGSGFSYEVLRRAFCQGGP